MAVHDPGDARIIDEWPDAHAPAHDIEHVGAIDNFPRFPTLTATYCHECVAYMVTPRWD